MTKCWTLLFMASASPGSWFLDVAYLNSFGWLHIDLSMYFPWLFSLLLVAPLVCCKLFDHNLLIYAVKEFLIVFLDCIYLMNWSKYSNLFYLSLCISMHTQINVCRIQYKMEVVALFLHFTEFRDSEFSFSHSRWQSLE